VAAQEDKESQETAKAAGDVKSVVSMKVGIFTDGQVLPG